MKPKLQRRAGPRFFVLLQNTSDEQGPLEMEDLRSMAEAGILTADDLVRAEDEADLHPIRDNAPLRADLWPEPNAFDPEDASVAAASVPSGHASTNSAEILRENVARDKAARSLAGLDPAPPRWRGVSISGFLVFRWILALLSLAAGIYFWQAGEGAGAAVTFFFGVGFFILAAALVGWELAGIVTAPVTGLVTSLLEGSGGGAKADYWTADSLVQQGELRLALSEFRKIVIQHPRELKAHAQGYRVAKSLGDEKEADRFYQLAMKNLRSEQDRNLFLNSLDRQA